MRTPFLQSKTERFMLADVVCANFHRGLHNQLRHTLHFSKHSRHMPDALGTRVGYLRGEFLYIAFGFEDEYSLKPALSPRCGCVHPGRLFSMRIWSAV